MQLERLRGHSVTGVVNRQIFIQFKSLFHIIEALSSARIEGNHTTSSPPLQSMIRHKLKKRTN